VLVQGLTRRGDACLKALYLLTAKGQAPAEVRNTAPDITQGGVLYCRKVPWDLRVEVPYATMNNQWGCVKWKGDGVGHMDSLRRFLP